MRCLVLALAWLGLGQSYPLSGKRYGGLVPLAPRLYYQPEPLDLYYPSEVQPYRGYSSIYDYLPYSYYQQEQPAYQDEDEEQTGGEEGDEWARDRTDKMFLHNLVLAQMYQDALDKLYGYYPGDSTYPSRVDQPYPSRETAYSSRDPSYLPSKESSYVYGEKIDSPRRDDEVQQLKSLGATDKKKSSVFRQEMARRRSSFPTNTWTDNSKRSDKGQDEVVLARPGPSSSARDRLYEPSPYDSVKKLLQLQDKLEQEAAESDTVKDKRSRQHKRSYVSSEEALVQELGQLKKSA